MSSVSASFSSLDLLEPTGICYTISVAIQVALRQEIVRREETPEVP